MPLWKPVTLRSAICSRSAWKSSESRHQPAPPPDLRRSRYSSAVTPHGTELAMVSPITGTAASSCDTFNPLGPWLATADEIADVNNLAMTLDVNGQRRQTGNTRTMVFPVDEIVRYLSHFMTLEPGDIINTGTPPGVGLGLKPPVYLKRGDVMELTIEGLGKQKQTCGQA